MRTLIRNPYIGILPPVLRMGTDNDKGLRMKFHEGDSAIASGSSAHFQGPAISCTAASISLHDRPLPGPSLSSAAHRE